MSSFVPWVLSERPGELDSLKINGNLSFTAEKSKKWLELLKAYKDKSKSDNKQSNY